MKVVITTKYWKKSDGGGLKNYVVDLADEFKKKDIEVSVFFREGIDYENYHIKGNKLLYSIKSFIKLRKIEPNVVHSHGEWYCLLPGYVYKKIYGIKLIHTFHTQPTKKLSFISIRFLQNLLNKCDCVTFVSNKLKEDHEKCGLTFKETEITYPGTNQRMVTQEEISIFCDKFGIVEDNFVLLGQGLTAHKLKAEGAKMMIKALKNLLNHHPEIILVLTREGKFSNSLKKIAIDENVINNVIFTGDLENPYIPLKICDIYTHISLAEGLPLALLEAMVMSKPIVATCIGGIPEAINNGVNGILIDPCEEQIISSVEYLIENKSLASKMADNAKETAINNFTWEKTANVFKNIYTRY